MISVIIPIYNAKKYLDRCVASVIYQTYNELEIILVDDGSSDGSLEICQKWRTADHRIKVFSQTNSGVSAARNMGLSHATSDYIMFVDSDDYMHPDMCETMYKTVLTKDADCVICGTCENNQTFWKPAKNFDYESLSSFKKDFIYHLKTELLSPPWNKIYKRSLITTDFDPEISFGEDLIFNLQYLKNCKRISFIDKTPFFHEKSNENSLVLKADGKKLKDIEQCHLAVIDFMENGNSSLKNNSKYIRDLVVYVRAFLTNSSIAYPQKMKDILDWRNISNIDSVSLHDCKHKRNRLLIWLLKHKMFSTAYIYVNWRKYVPFMYILLWNIQL